MASPTQSASLGFGLVAVEIGVHVGGYHNVYLAGVLGLIAVGCFAHAGWKWLGPKPAATPAVAEPSGARQPYVLTEWTNHSRYTVWVAACLWADTKPQSRIDASHIAYPALQKIKAAIKDGRIQAVVKAGDGGMNSEVTQDELYRLAERLGERPRFLYP